MRNIKYNTSYCVYCLLRNNSIIEFGPGGGKYGGEILYNGEKRKIKLSNQSLIKKYIDKIS